MSKVEKYSHASRRVPTASNRSNRKSRRDCKDGSIFLLITLSLFMACDGEKQTSPIPDSNLVQFQSCQSDTNCVFANNGCCDCANGGEEVAVNSNMLEDFESQFDCAGILCTLKGRSPACGTGTISCQNGLCSYELPDGVN